ncbi:MAG: bacteriohopanetetrol glucosamine biosynthesis glycosyltransferase HpnI [Desulfobaccales bacterium]
MIFLIFLVLAGLVYQVMALVALGRFFTAPPPSSVRPEAPGITVFKPVRGLEPDARECLRSFLAQDYPLYEVIFGVASAADPVLPLLEELRHEAPPGRVELVVCPESRGLNPKVSTLRHLEPLARFDLLVVADQDVKVGSDFLTRVAAAFEDAAVGLVSCLYRAGPRRTLGARLEALTISTDFIPGVVVARTVEGVAFALGAAMALTRRALEAGGGFAALADYLADDYQLGRRIHQAGFKVEVIPFVVETLSPSMSLGDYWAHQKRWTRTYRVCRPRGYLAYGITQVFVAGLALTLVSGGAPWALGLLTAALALRLGLAWFSEVACLGGSLGPEVLVLLPLKDVLSFALWVASFWGNEVVWQGRRYRLTPEGFLTPLARDS